MPRRPREESPTGLYHVTSRGTGGLLIYTDDADRTACLNFLATLSESEGWEIFAYCLLGTHFHFVLRAELDRLSTGMQRLKARYGQYFNERFDRYGHVFQGRFLSRPILSERHAVAACAYVAVNPVAAGLCTGAEQWRWSSHQAHVGYVSRPAFLESLEIVAEKERELYRSRARKAGSDPLRGSDPSVDALT